MTNYGRPGDTRLERITMLTSLYLLMNLPIMRRLVIGNMATLLLIRRL